MTTNTIHIIGLGVAEVAELTAVALAALQKAQAIIGTARQLATVAHVIDADKVEQIELPKLSELTALIDRFESKPIAVLASGDPLYYGIGRWFGRHFNQQQLHFYPAVSSIQVACHRLGIALQDVDVLSLHGRPLSKLRSQLKRNKALLVLTDKHSQPQRLAQECIAAGFSDSMLTVCENLGYTEEAITVWPVKELAHNPVVFQPLHVSYVQVLGSGGVLPEFPGIPDHHFQTGEVAGKGMISKREVRLTILSLMQVSAGDVVWDIGAGCGGVSVELALWNTGANIYALEYHPQRLMYLRENQQHFGVVHNLHITEGRAPEALAALPAPTKVFIGGSDGELAILLHQVWGSLPTRGVVVASAVTERTKEQLQQFAKTLLAEQVESVELSVKRGHLEGGHMQYEARLPVEIFKFSKTVGAV